MSDEKVGRASEQWLEVEPVQGDLWMSEPGIRQQDTAVDALAFSAPVTCRHTVLTRSIHIAKARLHHTGELSTPMISDLDLLLSCSPHCFGERARQLCDSVSITLSSSYPQGSRA